MDSRLEKHYTFKADVGIWQRDHMESFEYSDGADTENALLRALATTKDKSILSEELFHVQNDWASCYHFSSMRANLLRPLAPTALKNADVLELGCGCGAITRFLAEVASSVCAVEGSAKRAAITASRCSDMQNVRVIVDNIQALPTDLGKFDVVTLIGVLEYAGRFCDGEHPALSLLQIAHGFLKKGGRLVLALENKLGLKYFAGIPEEHLALAWGGIAGAYREHDVATYSRKELLALLEAAGFGICEQFIPIPDYKLPTGVLTPAGITELHADWDVAPFLWGRRAYEEQGIFNIPSAWDTVVKAGLLPDMANSLCFVAYAAQESPVQSAWEPDVLMYHYGHSLRESKKYAKCATFKRIDDGIHVCRDLLYPDLQNDGNTRFAFKPASEPYFAGTELLTKARQVTARPGWTVRALAESLFPWMKELQAHQDINGFLPAAFQDAAPFNATISNSGELRFFDLEWVAQEPISFLSTVTNHLYVTFDRLGGVCQPDQGVPLVYPELALSLLHTWGFGYSIDEMQSSWENDTTLWTEVLNAPTDWKLLRTRTLFVVPSVSYEAMLNATKAVHSAAVQERDAAVQECDAVVRERDVVLQERDAVVQERDAAVQERDAVVQERDAAVRLQEEKTREYYECSRSWRITAPLRKLHSHLGRILSSDKRGKLRSSFFSVEGLQRVCSRAKRLLSRLSGKNLQQAWRYTKQHGIRQAARRVAQEIRLVTRGQ